MRKTIAMAAFLIISTGVTGRELPTTKAERQGMSADRLNRITQMSRRYVESGAIPSLITMVARNGKIVHFEAVGNRGTQDAQPLRKDDLFRLYSMTKPITAVAAMQLYERGKFQLQDPVAKFVPELANLEVLRDGELVPVEHQMTMQQLLTHTAGLSHGIDPKDPVDKAYNEAKLWQSKNLDEFAAKLGKLPLKFEPGTQWHYSVASDVTGLVVQRLSGQPFDEYLRDHIFQPLGMKDTAFSVADEKLERFLPNHFQDPKGEGLKPIDPKRAPAFLGAIFDECRAMCDYRDVTLFSGGGGLVSTAMDYMRFAEMLRNGGELQGVRILGPKTVAYMTSNHLPASIKGGGNREPTPTMITPPMAWFGFGLGFGLVMDTTAIGIMGSVGEYFWTGSAGTAFWVDPVEDIVVVSMMQLMGASPVYLPDLKVATYQALTESKL